MKWLKKKIYAEMLPEEQIAFERKKDRFCCFVQLPKCMYALCYVFRLFHAVDINGDMWEDEIEEDDDDEDDDDDQFIPSAHNIEVEWFALIFCQVHKEILQDIQGPSIHSSSVEGRTGLYFPLVLLIKAHTFSM